MSTIRGGNENTGGVETGAKSGSEKRSKAKVCYCIQEIERVISHKPKLVDSQLSSRGNILTMCGPEGQRRFKNKLPHLDVEEENRDV